MNLKIIQKPASRAFFNFFIDCGTDGDVTIYRTLDNIDPKISIYLLILLQTQYILSYQKINQYIYYYKSLDIC